MSTAPPGRKWRLIVLAVLLTAAASGLAWHYAGIGGRTAGAADALTLSGNIEAHESVLGFKTVQSRIVALPFNEGQWVAKGATLAVLDDADYQQQIAIADANRALQQQQADTARQNLAAADKIIVLDETELAQRRLDQRRAQDLARQGFVSPSALDQSNTALQVAQAALARDHALRAVAAHNVKTAQAGVRSGEEVAQLARIVRGYTVLQAPFDGVITVRQAELGEVAVPGTPVVTIADLQHVWLRAYANETDLGKVKLGQAVSVTTDSRPGKHYQGRVSFIAAKAEFTPKSVETHAERVTLVYRLKIDLDNPAHELLPGMPADARIELAAAGRP
ncbi:HlyD family secretion protein [Duganella vulcania]|uniref:HlyD family efflux transporter periplasmic adaptor subunit n=1 Tax=Duganella vulcania TaxID=2692166 RepID=A0A845GWM7_9BURK|nr:efflux RND transporter periplasmic adaptor subunit [Duganella vulcania]MYM97770.1 HlyD family efflux transporter periplasmic adaptor subunit [Duganella vulcania]